jgi:hypothetical protein
MRHRWVAALGDVVPESSAKKNEALTKLHLTEPTASKGGKLATL